MRVVLDTNVLLAAFMTRGHCHELLEHCLGEHRVILSRYILSEFEEKLVKKARYSVADAKAAVGFVRTATEIVAPIPLPVQICRDADDDWVLATAKGGDCDCLATGDKDLLTLREFEGIPILKPSDFWSFEQRHQ